MERPIAGSEQRIAGSEQLPEMHGKAGTPADSPRKRTKRPARWSPIVLENDRLDLAVARGAAYYGMVRRGHGVRIAAGLARTYYIGVEGGNNAAGAEQSPRPGNAEAKESLPPTPESRAVCLLPAGIEPGHDVALTQRRFELLVSEPAEFPLFFSSTRLTDKPGELVPVDRERMTPLPAIRTVLRAKKNSPAETVSVTLHAAAHRDRHAGPVAQRDRRPAKLAASVRRSFHYADRYRRPPVAGRGRGHGRRGHLAAVPSVDRGHLRPNQRQGRRKNWRPKALTLTLSQRERGPIGERERGPIGERERGPIGERERGPIGERERGPIGEREGGRMERRGL